MSRLKKASRVAIVASAAVLMLAISSCTADTPSPEEGTAWPERDITLVIPFGPGGSFTATGQPFAEQLAQELGVGVTVKFTEGGGGSLGTNQVVTAKPDGYTIGLSSTPILSFTPLQNPDLVFQSPDDYGVVSTANTTAGGMLAVRPDSPWSSLEDLMDDAKSRPGEITVSTPGVGNLLDLGMRHFQYATGDLFRIVPFDAGGGESLLALINGQVDVTIGNPVTLAGQLEAGEVVGLGHLTDQSLADQVAALEELPSGQGFVDDDEGFQITTESRTILITPPGVPSAILDKLEAAAVKVAKSDAYVQIIRNLGGLPSDEGAAATRTALEKASAYYRFLFDNVDLGN